MEAHSRLPKERTTGQFGILPWRSRGSQFELTTASERVDKVFSSVEWRREAVMHREEGEACRVVYKEVADVRETEPEEVM